ncbi:protein Shroom1 isoform X3 [Heterocephalus glaber]|uniref:Protein Shroom1 isoform X3 n=1 Tax=Heterocephalus glaber TaxID=10181 RepID=A0AAX6RNZ6_HETGA|nr:protein Shroom1 isoform X3 [Heterocephalus glaber]
MEALGPGGERASPAACPGSPDLGPPSTRADSAYSSFSGGPEPRAPSPAAVLPHLDGDYVRAVWGGPGPAPPDATQSAAQRPGPAVAAHSGLQGAPGRLSRQATPLLYALAAEAEAGVRAAEPPSPPASRAAYRQRLRGAQRRVLRETSFQRRELRVSLPARLRPAAPAHLPPAHPRSSSLSHPGGDCRAPAPGTAGQGRLASQQRKWCFSEPGKLDRVGRGCGPAGEGLSETCFSPGLAGPEPQELPRAAGAAFQGLPRTQHQSTAELDSGSAKLGGASAPRPGSRRQSASGEVLGPCTGPGGVVALVQAVPPGPESPRPLFQTTFSRFLPQKEAVLVCPAAGPRSSLADCEERLAETCTEPARLPSLPDDEVFLEEAPLNRLRLPQGAPARSCLFSFTQLLPASQETRPENATLLPVPNQPCGQGLPAQNVSIQVKKVELAGLLQKMLQDLHARQEQLQGVAQAWARRRAALEAAVAQACAPRELERFSRFMADLERVLGLLLLLGSRLARVHRALARVGSDGDPEERASLLQRLGLLRRQQEDARELKEHVSRRERALREVLARALPAEEVRAYCTLLADKAAVLAQQRSLDERVRLLQDQLDAVRSDLSPRPSRPPRTCPPDKQPFPPPPV